MQSPLLSGLTHLVLSELAPHCGAHLVRGQGQRLPSHNAALDSARDSGTLTFMKWWHCHLLWPCWVWVVERNVLLRNLSVFFPLCSGPNSLMLEQCPGGDGGRLGAMLCIGRQRGPQAQKWAVMFPCMWPLPYCKVSLGSQSVCVGCRAWLPHVQRQAPKYSCEGRATRAGVHLRKLCTCLWFWGNVFARCLAVWVTLLSSQPLGREWGGGPGSGAGMFSCWSETCGIVGGPRRSPFCCRVHGRWQPPRSGAQLGRLLSGMQGPGTSLSWACLSTRLMGQTLGWACEILLF